MKRLTTLSLFILLTATASAQSPWELALQKAVTQGGVFGMPRYTTAARPACSTSNTGAALVNTSSSNVLQICNGTTYDTYGGAAIAIGTAISGGAANRVLFEDASQLLATDADFTFLTDTLSATKLLSTTSVTVGTSTTAGTATAAIDSAMAGASATDNFFNVTGSFQATPTVGERGAMVTFAKPNFEIVSTAEVSSSLYAEMTGGRTSGNDNNGNAAIYGKYSASSRATAPNETRIDSGVRGEVVPNSNFVNGSVSAGVHGLTNGTPAGGTHWTFGVLGGTFNGGSRAGVYGFGQVNGTDFTAGGAFVLNGNGQTNPITVPFTGAIAALIAGNGTQAQDIFRLYDNTTQVLTVADGGILTSFGANSVGSSMRTYNTNASGFAGFEILDSTAVSTPVHVGYTNASWGGFGGGSAGIFTTRTATPLILGTNSIQRLYIEDAAKTLTDNTVATIFTFTLGNDIVGGGVADFCVYANDNTNDGRQMTCGTITFTGVDKTAGAGGEACNVGIGTNVTSLSPTNGGTILTVTASATTGTDLCNVRVTADSDLAVITNLQILYQIRANPSSSTFAITPQ